MAIQTFKHKGLKKLFKTGNRAGIQTAHTNKIERILDRLNAAIEVQYRAYRDMDLHPLKGDLKDFYSVHVNGNWTIIFRFENGEANDVNLIDYH